MDSASLDGLKLNLGCGPVQPKGWVNIDGSNRARLANKVWWLDQLLVKSGVLSPTEFGPHVKIANLFKPLPFADESVDAVYAGEVWEHFEFADAERLTRECLRVLKVGGALRVTVPDVAALWGKYMGLYAAEIAKPRHERSSAELHKLMGLFFADIATRPRILGSWGHFHKWMFDEVQLIELFERSGFTQVERMPFRKSRIAGIEGVQRSDMLTVEGVKS